MQKIPTFSVREIGKLSYMVKCFDKAVSAKYFGDNACLLVWIDSRAKICTFISNLKFFRTCSSPATVGSLRCVLKTRPMKTGLRISCLALPSPPFTLTPYTPPLHQYVMTCLVRMKMILFLLMKQVRSQAFLPVHPHTGRTGSRFPKTRTVGFAVFRRQNQSLSSARWTSAERNFACRISWKSITASITLTSSVLSVVGSSPTWRIFRVTSARRITSVSPASGSSTLPTSLPTIGWSTRTRRSIRATLVARVSGRRPA